MSVRPMRKSSSIRGSASQTEKQHLRLESQPSAPSRPGAPRQAPSLPRKMHHALAKAISISMEKGAREVLRRSGPILSSANTRLRLRRTPRNTGSGAKKRGGTAEGVRSAGAMMGLPWRNGGTKSAGCWMALPRRRVRSFSPGDLSLDGLQGLRCPFTAPEAGRCLPLCVTRPRHPEH